MTAFGLGFFSPNDGMPQRVRLSDLLGRIRGPRLVRAARQGLPCLALTLTRARNLRTDRMDAATKRHAAQDNRLSARLQHGPHRQTDCAAQHAGAKRQPQTGIADFRSPPLLRRVIGLLVYFAIAIALIAVACTQADP